MDADLKTKSKTGLYFFLICVYRRISAAKSLFRRLCVFAVLVFLFACSTLAQSRGGLGWAWQNPLPQGNPLYAIHFAKNKTSGFAVGSDNTILHTTDGGFTWLKQTSATDVELSGVWVRDENSAIIVGSRGTILSTTNGGKTWRQVSTEVRDHFYGIGFSRSNPDVGWIVGTYGRVLKTADGGATWQSQTSNVSDHLLKVASFDDKHAVAVGLNGVVVATQDGCG